jgi:hypothetical protein
MIEAGSKISANHSWISTRGTGDPGSCVKAVDLANQVMIGATNSMSILPINNIGRKKIAWYDHMHFI